VAVRCKVQFLSFFEPAWGSPGGLDTTMEEQLTDSSPALVMRSLSAGMEMFRGKWKLSILWYLEQRPRRFGELAALLPAITAKVLTYQLRELEEAGLIRRTNMMYALTEYGDSAQPLLQLLWEWGNWQLRREAMKG
jgi:DNA-binding HxlR family transcriptional regulator